MIDKILELYETKLTADRELHDARERQRDAETELIGYILENRHEEFLRVDYAKLRKYRNYEIRAQLEDERSRKEVY